MFNDLWQGLFESQLYESAFVQQKVNQPHGPVLWENETVEV